MTLQDYFRRLKFIQIEQETKNLFVKFISDEEMEFFEPADVANLGELGGRGSLHFVRIYR